MLLRIIKLRDWNIYVLKTMGLINKQLNSLCSYWAHVSYIGPVQIRKLYFRIFFFYFLTH